jgi:hypothetical protein
MVFKSFEVVTRYLWVPFWYSWMNFTCKTALKTFVPVLGNEVKRSIYSCLEMDSLIGLPWSVFLFGNGFLDRFSLICALDLQELSTVWAVFGNELLFGNVFLHRFSVWKWIPWSVQEKDSLFGNGFLGWVLSTVVWRGWVWRHQLPASEWLCRGKRH